MQTKSISRRVLTRVFAFLALAALAAGSAVAHAQSLPAPSGTPILEITGRIAVTNGETAGRVREHLEKAAYKVSKLTKSERKLSPID
jgi:ABC-type sugar transport system substrate-binding protein